MNQGFLMCLIVIYILYRYGLISIATKKIGAVKGSRTRKLVWQFFFAAALALITAMITEQLTLNWIAISVAVIGAANAFGCYCYWRAVDLSMSRAAMFSNLDDLLAIGLGYAFLDELKVLTPILAAGIVLSIISATIFARIKRLNNGVSEHFLGWVLSYSGIWGIAMFSMRFFSIHGLNLLTFVAAWYVGSWLGALFLRFIIMERKEAGSPLAYAQLTKVFLLAIGIWTAQMLGYLILKLTPITVIQPILMVAEMSVPAITAMIFFGEARDLSRQEIIVIASGLIGITLIAIGF